MTSNQQCVWRTGCVHEVRCRDAGLCMGMAPKERSMAPSADELVRDCEALLTMHDRSAGWLKERDALLIRLRAHSPVETTERSCACIPMAPRPWKYCANCGGRIPMEPTPKEVELFDGESHIHRRSESTPKASAPCSYCFGDKTVSMSDGSKRMCELCGGTGRVEVNGTG